jgi:hypothetical protein
MFDISFLNLYLFSPKDHLPLPLLPLLMSSATPPLTIPPLPPQFEGGQKICLFEENMGFDHCCSLPPFGVDLLVSHFSGWSSCLAMLCYVPMLEHNFRGYGCSYTTRIGLDKCFFT